MSLRAFFRALFRKDTGHAKPRHAGHELAERIDEAMGPQAGGGGHGRMTGGGVYRYLEGEDPDER